jgi:hypothetical protein
MSPWRGPYPASGEAYMNPKYKKETSIVACEHFIDNHQVPCPPMCPRQDWPRSRFRLRFWVFGRLVPR